MRKEANIDKLLEIGRHFLNLAPTQTVSRGHLYPPMIRERINNWVMVGGWETMREYSLHVSAILRARQTRGEVPRQGIWLTRDQTAKQNQTIVMMRPPSGLFCTYFLTSIHCRTVEKKSRALDNWHEIHVIADVADAADVACRQCGQCVKALRALRADDAWMQTVQVELAGTPHDAWMQTVREGCVSTFSYLLVPT